LSLINIWSSVSLLHSSIHILHRCLLNKWRSKRLLHSTNILHRLLRILHSLLRNSLWILQFCLRILKWRLLLNVLRWLRISNLRLGCGTSEWFLGCGIFIFTDFTCKWTLSCLVSSVLCYSLHGLIFCDSVSFFLGNIFGVNLLFYLWHIFSLSFQSIIISINSLDWDFNTSFNLFIFNFYSFLRNVFNIWFSFRLYWLGLADINLLLLNRLLHIRSSHRLCNMLLRNILHRCLGYILYRLLYILRMLIWLISIWYLLRLSIWIS